VDIDGDGMTLLLLFVEKEGKMCDPIDVMEGDFLNMTEEELDSVGCILDKEMDAKHANKAIIK
jgi:hypothetical protein